MLPTLTPIINLVFIEQLARVEEVRQSYVEMACTRGRKTRGSDRLVHRIMLIILFGPDRLRSMCPRYDFHVKDVGQAGSWLAL